MSSNDYNIQKIDGEEVLMPGLGADEPDDDMKEAMRTRGMSSVLKLKKKLEEQASGLTEKERAIAEQSRQQEIARKQLEAKEKDLAKREAELAAKETKAGK